MLEAGAGSEAVIAKSSFDAGDVESTGLQEKDFVCSKPYF
jgi:hypothetical protein